MEIDYEKMGLKVGLEIHQQLETKTKLFCNCKPELFKEEPEITFLRRLRPTQSELGQVDPAAYFEFQKGINIRYEGNEVTSCLVEMDEEPPHPLNKEALEIALIAASIMKAKPVDEVHVMRKTVIDGSNTTGFQRTCVIALNGSIQVGDKVVPIQHLSLEEDAARKFGDEEEGKVIRYRIDRLGIPLIEVATAPVIRSPDEAQKVAFAIGKILRDTGKVMRGLGTIRQDLNISIPKGALVEIKGVQELELISRVVEYEVQRQLGLLNISKELKKKAIKVEELTEDFVDVTDIFQKTNCKIIRKALKSKHKIKAVKLSKFKGFLRMELGPNFHLGKELADRAKFWGRVGGIFHTDELPKYGVTIEEVEMLRKAVGSDEEDAVVFVAGNPENATDALKAVIERAKEAVDSVPSETRSANSDGTTRYMRPRPGAARMYPETDIPPSIITRALVDRIQLNLPEPRDKKLARLSKEYQINKKLARQIVDSEYDRLFEAIAEERSVPATMIAVFLSETLKSLKRDGIAIEKVEDDKIMEIFRLVGSGKVAKEALADIFVWISNNEEKNVHEAIGFLNLEMLSKTELKKFVDEVISENKQTISKMEKNAFGILMGIAMKKVRGKADPKLVGKFLKQRLEQLSSSH